MKVGTLKGLHSRVPSSNPPSCINDDSDEEDQIIRASFAFSQGYDTKFIENKGHASVEATKFLPGTTAKRQRADTYNGLNQSNVTSELNSFVDL